MYETGHTKLGIFIFYLVVRLLVFGPFFDISSYQSTSSFSAVRSRHILFDCSNYLVLRHMSGKMNDFLQEITCE